jgi:hypothetical protein
MIRWQMPKELDRGSTILTPRLWRISMKPLLWFSAVLLLAFSAMHIFITYEHWRESPQRESVLAPALLALVTAALALWLIRLARRQHPTASK